MARPVTAGEVRQGQSGQGTSWRVKARFDVAGMFGLGKAGGGMIRPGKAWQVWRVMFRYGIMRRVAFWFGRFGKVR